MSSVNLTVDLKTGKFQKNNVTMRALKDAYYIRDYFKKHGDVPEEFQYLKEGGWDYVFQNVACSDEEWFLVGWIKHLLCKKHLEDVKKQMGDDYNEEIEEEIIRLYEPNIKDYSDIVFLDDDDIE